MKLRKQRRIENKTNYNKRLKLLKGSSPRLVVRKTNKYLTLQIVESKNAQDSIIDSTSTKDLLKTGWPPEKKGSLKSLSACYLAGLMLGKKIKLKDRIILDSGLVPNTKGSRIYAAVKGLADAGIEINYDEKIMPAMEKIEGKENKLNDIFKKIKEKIK